VQKFLNLSFGVGEMKYHHRWLSLEKILPTPMRMWGGPLRMRMWVGPFLRKWSAVLLL